MQHASKTPTEKNSSNFAGMCIYNYTCTIAETQISQQTAKAKMLQEVMNAGSNDDTACFMHAAYTVTPTIHSTAQNMLRTNVTSTDTGHYAS
jgi:hypothetical protein